MNYPDDCPPNRKDAPWNAPDNDWACDTLAVCSWCQELKETNSDEMCEECYREQVASEEE